MFVVGTAGHVDHGKSTLVRALTGIDPDRLREEQERAMTIDLGFAWLTLPSGREASLVDVPGHERFIKNMLAGVGGIDAALLVIAADEGPMPQTAEHLAILDLLGIERGIVVLTKCDLVEPEWLALVQEEVHDCLTGTTLAAAPLVTVSATTGHGLDELRQTLDGMLAAIPAPIDVGRPRLPIDRVFTITGFGTVVTGTLSGGSLRVGDDIEVQPGGRRARIRGLQSHQQRIERAGPSSRVAVNLTSLAVADLQRGDVLTLPGWMRPSNRLDLRVRLVAAAPRPIGQNELVDFFTGSAEVAGHLTLLDADELLPGSEGWVQIRLAQAVAVERGDRFIIRQPSPSITIGGGAIVDAHPRRHRRFDTATLATLETLQRGTPSERVLQAVTGTPLDFKTLLDQIALPSSELTSLVSELLASGSLLIIDPRPPSIPRAADMLTTPATWASLTRALADVLIAYHTQFPLRCGAPREEVRSRLRLPSRLFEKTLALATSQGIVADEGALLRLPDHTITFTPAQEEEARRLLAALTAQAVTPPSIGELRVDPEILAALVHQGHVVRVSDTLVFLPDPYTTMVDWVLATIDREGSVTVAAVRDHFSSSRKHVLALLEHLDQRRVTRRQGDSRVRW